jgi:hypothetical protein
VIDRDKKVSEWAIGFLNEYRINKGEINSDFYPIHIPAPPVPPAVAPPTDADWHPFPNPAGLSEAEEPISGVSKYGYKVKQPLPDIEGGAVGGGPAPYYNRDAFNRAYR